MAVNRSTAFRESRLAGKPLALCVLVIATTSSVNSAAAATWLVMGPSNAQARDRVAIDIRASGDSAMVAGQVTVDFDESLLAVAVDTRNDTLIVGLNGGECRLVGTRTIVVATPPEPRLLPSDPTSFCSVTLQVQDRVPTSTTRLRLADAECVDSTGAAVSCETEELTI